MEARLGPLVAGHPGNPAWAAQHSMALQVALALVHALFPAPIHCLQWAEVAEDAAEAVEG